MYVCMYVCGSPQVCAQAGLSVLPAALECSPRRDLVIDLCMSDLQTRGHRQLLQTDEGTEGVCVMHVIQA